jgi:hypothetical protein
MRTFSILQGLEAMNRAVDGDTVAVTLLDKDQWSGSLEVINYLLTRKYIR